MREPRLRRLEKRRVGGAGDDMQLAYELPRTASGKVYRFLPNPDAVPRLFLIGDAPDERNIAPENRQRIRRKPGYIRTSELVNIIVKKPGRKSNGRQA